MSATLTTCPSHQTRPTNTKTSHVCCNLPLFGTCYTCSPCNFYLHKFCFDLPQSSYVAAHPNHTLGLLYPPYCRGPCDSCGESCNGLTYNCTFCNYNIHANCAVLLHSEPQNERDQYASTFFRHKVAEMKSLRSQLGSVSAKKQQDEEEEARQKQKEREEELRRMRMDMHMQQIQRMSDSIDFMGQIGSSTNYTYRYY
ncbi:hypothetical protein Salat_2853200 [Sesamum alatum]|uniref:DC1 domain-containing protein n=1 Tax=Sesamum alatum TaxID=300844 RepID=A0AAE1XN31_9LAMI|nr:hypothetical protein Salat_2853200 [Sesamum alatum]